MQYVDDPAKHSIEFRPKHGRTMENAQFSGEQACAARAPACAVKCRPGVKTRWHPVDGLIIRDDRRRPVVPYLHGAL